ncbi:MAG: GNAT family N-acetyltransferase [Clostridia bacterium]|nr:GNAT family N-acetyltransferase [Clostridia bacterium]
MDIRKLTAADLRPGLLHDFNHIQNWTEQWVSTDAGWQLQPLSASRTWDAEKRVWMVSYLQAHLDRGGKLFGAFDGSRLVGFSAVDAPPIGEYASLTLLFVDDDYKRQGLGRTLFRMAADAAKELGARKLFISSIPSPATVAFYFAMGCTDAAQCIPAFMDSETDRWLEVPLN